MSAMVQATLLSMKIGEMARFHLSQMMMIYLHKHQHFIGYFKQKEGRIQTVRPSFVLHKSMMQFIVITIFMFTFALLK
jgi:hypothetical protein